MGYHGKEDKDQKGFGGGNCRKTVTWGLQLKDLNLAQKTHSSPMAVQSGEHHIEASRGFPCVGNIWGICGRHMGDLQAVLMVMFKKVEAIAGGRKRKSWE